MGGDREAALQMIESIPWTVDSLWSRAGLIGQLCTDSFSVELPAMTSASAGNRRFEIHIKYRLFVPGADSVRILLPVPQELPWQYSSGDIDMEVNGLNGDSRTYPGWLEFSGIQEDTVTVFLSGLVTTVNNPYPGANVTGVEDAMVCYPGEDPFIDSCLDLLEGWTGGDRIYVESVTLARGEPNPMRLAERVLDRISEEFSVPGEIDERILLTPESELALQGELSGSAAGAFLGAAIIRRWQIPALPVTGAYNGGSSSGYALYLHVKPFQWMSLSPVPEDFVALGSVSAPEMRSWPWGVPGLAAIAEYRGEDCRWHAVTADLSFSFFSVRISGI